MTTSNETACLSLALFGDKPKRILFIYVNYLEEQWGWKDGSAIKG